MQTTRPRPPSSEPAAEPVRPATAGENLLTLLCGVWLVVGLFIDGYAHAEILDTETEDFFTPWHGIFYSGFMVTVAVVGLIAQRRARPGPVRAWLPHGYGLAAIGIAIFAVGGFGDGIWHTLLGVEVGVDALLSPTHLLLFVGMSLILTTPLRAAWVDPAHRSGWRDLGGAIFSAAIATSLVTFFFSYVFGPGETELHRVPFDPVTDVGEGPVMLALASAYVATAILVIGVLALLQRWDLPRGAITTVWMLPVLLELLAFGDAIITAPAALAGGVAAELTLAALRGRIDRRHAIVAAMLTGMTVLWSVWMLLNHLTEGVRWIPELWTGQIVVCGLIAGALALLAFPPARAIAPKAPALTLDHS